MTKKLYRSRSDRMLAGVCGGLASYFGVDVTIVRILFALFALAGGPGLILYGILYVIIPEDTF